METLKEAVKKPKEKKNIEKALRSYLSTIIWLKYHPQFVYKECKKTFKKSHIENLEVFDMFLKRFNGADESYVVYFLVNKKVLKFKEILETRLGVKFEQDQFSSKLKNVSSENICINLSVLALDVNGAASQAYETFANCVTYRTVLRSKTDAERSERTGFINFHD